MKHEHSKKAKIDLANLGNVTIGRGILEPGWSWEKCVKPIVKTNSCEAPHTHPILCFRKIESSYGRRF